MDIKFELPSLKRCYFQEIPIGRVFKHPGKLCSPLSSYLKISTTTALCLGTSGLYEAAEYFMGVLELYPEGCITITI